MQKAYLLSLVIMSLVIPIKMASYRKPTVGLKRTTLYMLAFLVAWGFGAIYVYWKLPE